MKINDLEVEGYGVWSGLKIEKFGETLNVFYGRNEAGKTTLLQFIRSMLYGFSPKRRQYLPPVHGGRPGGQLHIDSPQGRFEIRRYDATSPEGVPAEQVILTAPDGTRQGEHFLKVLLANVDESVFNNIFAIGLREIQELATLSDTEAAEQLYSLSAGLDRISLVDVLREMAASRNRILDAKGRPCQLVQLMAEREKLCAAIEELSSVNRRYGHLAGQRDHLSQEITRLEEDVTRTEQLCQVVESALSLRDRWQQRAALDEQIALLGPQNAVPEDALERFDRIHDRLRRHHDHLQRLDEQRIEAKREYAAITVNESLWHQTSRIAALKEQEPWIVQLQGQIDELQKETDQSEADLTKQRERLGLSDDFSLPAVSAKSLASLRSPMKQLRQCRMRMQEAQEAAATSQQSAQSLSSQIESELASRGTDDLPTAMDQAGGLVSQLRRRIQMDERLDQLTRYQGELEQRSRHLIDKQLLPVSVLIGLGAMFVLGAVMLLAGLFLTVSITLTLLGLGGGVAAAAMKVMIERSNIRQLDSCQKQLAMLQQQVQQAKEDRDALDSQLPSGSGSITNRLHTAEQDLASLEELAPLDARRNTARQETESAQRRLQATEEELRSAKRRWRDGLRNIGLPEDFKPQQIRRLMQHGDRLHETKRRIAQRREDIARRRQELQSITARITQLADDAGVKLSATAPIEQLRQLAETASRQSANATQRDAIRRRAKRLKLARSKHEEAVTRLKRRRRELLAACSVKDEQELRQLALQSARAEVLRHDRETIAREIAAAIASKCSEEVIRDYLNNHPDGQLEARHEELQRRLAAMQQQLRELLENRGRLTEQLAALASDRQLADKQLDLSILDCRIEEAAHRWQVLAVTCCLLDMIRTTYERDRQPETLREASAYLDRLTQGRYHRVWTPLGEHALRVDDDEGNSLPVEVLSRGTREQLFLSLRLALASTYARRGAVLPIVLDDVLVNFDSDRARAAAEVLRDFAALGHQLLVFTCHEHMFELFKTLRVPVSQLPNNAKPGRISLLSERNSEKPKTEKPLPSERRKPPMKKKQAVEPDAESPAAEDPKPAAKPKRATRKRRQEAAFDVDYFDPQEDAEEEPEEEEEEAEEEASEEDNGANDAFDEEEEENLWDEDESEDEIEEFDDDDTAAA